MRKIICILLSLAVVFLLCSCKENGNDIKSQNNSSQKKSDSASEDFDVDLTLLNSNMVYAEVYDMIYNPENYVGKTVKMEGTFAVYEGYRRPYFNCIIADATACCSQGLEFELAGDYTYPDDYPDIDSQITVSGDFETYEDDGYTYFRLANAKMYKKRTVT